MQSLVKRSWYISCFSSMRPHKTLVSSSQKKHALIFFKSVITQAKKTTKKPSQKQQQKLSKTFIQIACFLKFYCGRISPWFFFRDNLGLCVLFYSPYKILPIRLVMSSGYLEWLCLLIVRSVFIFIYLFFLLLAVSQMICSRKSMQSAVKSIFVVVFK